VEKMRAPRYLQYRVKLSRDKATGLIVAEVPTLGIADDGIDHDEALRNIRQMITFHLSCLGEEGKLVPLEKRTGEGVYVRIRAPARAG
jgi:predicted RNase H-like HicB family nuclease